MNYTKLTLGNLLSSSNETIRRNAISILKQLQRDKGNCVKNTFACPYCGSFEVEVEMGINGSDYIVCRNCKRKSNVYQDEN